MLNSNNPIKIKNNPSINFEQFELKESIKKNILFKSKIRENQKKGFSLFIQTNDLFAAITKSQQKKLLF